MVESIILDCDPGHDDAIAILLAAGNPHIDLVGITTVAGNHTIENVTRNALSVCRVAGLTVPVVRGAAAPLVAPQIVAEDIHGKSGLDGPALPEPLRAPDPRTAAEFIVETILDQPPHTINLVPVGPLTNIALALRLEPRIVERVKSVVVMGGSYTRGNVTPSAEFNIYADPEAAEAVFRTDWDVTMIGLDLTHQALATVDLQKRIRMIDSEISQFVLDAWEFVGSTYRHHYGFPCPPVHDACCVAAVIDPTILTTAPADVRIELTGTWTRGMTVTNFEKVPGMHHSNGSAVMQSDYRTQVALKLDWHKFADQIVDAVSFLSQK